MGATPCYCCADGADFALTAVDEDPMPLCDACLDAHLHNFPEEGARLQLLDTTDSSAKRALRAVCSALKRNCEYIDANVADDEGDVPIAERAVAQAVMNRLRAELEVLAS